jgi:hypothetical protein
MDKHTHWAIYRAIAGRSLDETMPDYARDRATYRQDKAGRWEAEVTMTDAEYRQEAEDLPLNGMVAGGPNDLAGQ